jgi:hypothetical protein
VTSPGKKRPPQWPTYDWEWYSTFTQLELEGDSTATKSRPWNGTEISEMIISEFLKKKNFDLCEKNSK